MQSPVAINNLKMNVDLEHKINEFKNDKQQMEVLLIFINDIIHNAKLEAEKKLDFQKSQQSKSSRSNSLVSVLRNGRMANRARGFMIRMYDVICNCANTAKAPTQRFNLKPNNINNNN